MSRLTQSGRGYCGMRRVENILLASVSWEGEEELMRFSPGSVVWFIRECFP